MGMIETKTQIVLGGAYVCTSWIVVRSELETVILPEGEFFLVTQEVTMVSYPENKEEPFFQLLSTQHGVCYVYKYASDLPVKPI